MTTRVAFSKTYIGTLEIFLRLDQRIASSMAKKLTKHWFGGNFLTCSCPGRCEQLRPQAVRAQHSGFVFFLHSLKVSSGAENRTSTLPFNSSLLGAAIKAELLTEQRTLVLLLKNCRIGSYLHSFRRVCFSQSLSRIHSSIASTQKRTAPDTFIQIIQYSYLLSGYSSVISADVESKHLDFQFAKEEQLGQSATRTHDFS